jgi:hypothetical protein
VTLLSSLTLRNTDKAVASLSIDTVTYHPKYKQAVDGVVLVSSDEVAFRVEDFYLKASRSVAIFPLRESDFRIVI